MQYLPSPFFNVPFVYPLKKNLRADGVISIHGFVQPNADRFTLNLQAGPGDHDDRALHLSFRFPEGVVVLNTKQGGDWQNEERHHSLPVNPGQYFQMLVWVQHHQYKIAFNGVHFADFHHRMPFEIVSFVGATGDVQINHISGIRGPSEPENVVYNPETPFVQYVGSVFPGRLIRVRGNIPHDCYRFSVNLQSGADGSEIALHVSVRPNSSERLVELNSKRHGSWESSVQIQPSPVYLGQAFELLILVDQDHYKVAFNGQHFTEFPHRHPIDSVDHIRIADDVRITKVSVEGQRRDDGFGWTPMPAPANDYYHPLPYPELAHHFIYANPYPLY